jgi:hypothetical protein
VELMLSFDITAVDVVLLIAVLVLFLLFIAQRRSQVVSETQLPAHDRVEIPEKPETTVQASKGKPSVRHSPEDFQRCIHNFGYLKNLPANTPVPDECFGCTKAMRCLFPDAQTQLVE